MYIPQTPSILQFKKKKKSHQKLFFFFFPPIPSIPCIPSFRVPSLSHHETIIIYSENKMGDGGNGGERWVRSGAHKVSGEANMAGWLCEAAALGRLIVYLVRNILLAFAGLWTCDLKSHDSLGGWMLRHGIEGITSNCQAERLRLRLRLRLKA